MFLTTADGTALRVEWALPGGRSHRTFRARSADGSVVLVKTDGDPAGLTHEFAVLQGLAAAGFPAPLPLALTRIPTIGGRWRLALLLSWVDGTVPNGTAAWRRLGARLAQLHRLPPVPGVPVRLSMTVADLPGSVRSAVGERRAMQMMTAASPGDELVLSHGDAGPENFLDHPDGGSLIDFEATCRQPAGADLGRCLFLLTDAGRSPSDAGAALLAGYGAGALPVPELFGWAAREGLRVAVWRRRHAGRPGVPDWRRAVATALRCWSQASLREAPAC
ncbi:phosphotransferase family protein [Micromonospora sp. NPDC049175]|uniref:phosphotransferase family protein n=1 Tax=Micromonospora sp. NPDC049175 TaxID=3364266 RepID=UPI003722BDCB